MLLVNVLLGALALGGSSVRATELNSDRLQKVYDVMNQIAQYSWENGTRAEAILEWRYPSLSVYSATPSLPLPDPLPSGDISELLSIAQDTLENRPISTNSSSSSSSSSASPTSTSSAANATTTTTNSSSTTPVGSSLLDDGAAADPASLGVTVLLAGASQSSVRILGVGYQQAAELELNYLLYDVPRTSTGAISHRADQAQLWADFVYMVPPFLAYYGALTSNSTLLQIAYDQCRLYRQGLRQSSGLWYHIVGGTGSYDPNTWLTGNAWAAAGMLRVWATMHQSGLASSFSSQMSDLASWSQEILQASMPLMTSNGLLRNYMEDTTSFEEASGSALIAATGLRLSTLNITSSYVNQSLTLLSAVSSKVNSTGYLTQVVNPTDFNKQGTESPEGQSFVMLAYAAFNDWEKAGKQGATNGDSPLGGTSGAGAVVKRSGWGLGLVLALGLGLGALV